MAAVPGCFVYDKSLLGIDGDGDGSGGAAPGSGATNSGGDGNTGNTGGNGSPTGGMGGDNPNGTGGGTPVDPNLFIVTDASEPSYDNSPNPFYGQWDRYNDNSGGSWDKGLSAMFEPRADDASNTALHVKGSGFSDWGVGVFVTLKQGAGAAESVDLTAYDGLRFFAKSDDESKKVSVKFADVASHQPNCESATPSSCNNHAGGAPRTLTNAWKEYTIAFPLPERDPAFDYTKAFAIHFTLDPADNNVDFWIDDIAFFKN